MEKFISNIELRELLENATYDEKLSITKILDKTKKEPFSAKELQKEICWEGGHGIVNIWRGEGTGYLDIVDEVADELKIKYLPSYNLKVKYFDEIDILNFDKETARKEGIKYAEEAEEKIILKLLEHIYKELDTDKKEEFDKQLNKIAQNYDSDMSSKLAGTAGILALGNLGGFATYTFLTTALSTISMGTLGFGAYTAATSLLSIALGPVGWAGLGLAGVFAIGKPSYQKLIPIVAMIGAIRQRVKYDSNQNLEKNKENKENINSLSIEELISQILNKKIKKLPKIKLNYNETDDNGITVLMAAIDANNIDIVKTLLELQIDIDKQNKEGYSAIMLASMKGYLNIVKCLIDYKANINLQNKLNLTALHLSSMNNHLKITKILRENNADIELETIEGFTPFMIASYDGNIETIKYLANYIDINKQNNKGFTALMWASFSKKLEIVQFLIENNANINIQDNDGFTALIWASLRGNIDIVKFLVQKKDININQQNKYGFTALMWASLRNHADIVILLLKYNANKKLKSLDEKTALDLAKEKNNKNIIIILDNNISKEKKDNNKCYTIDTISFKNFKAFGNQMQTFIKKPITLLYGPNSIGKSSVIQLVTYLKSFQDDNNIDVHSINKFGDKIDLGGIEQFIHKRDKENNINIIITLKNYDDDIYQYIEDKLVNLKISYTINIKDLEMVIEYKNNDHILAKKTISYDKNYTIKNSNYTKDSCVNLANLINEKLKHRTQYIGPIRPNPERWYNFNIIDEKECLNSQNLWAILADNHEILKQVNEKLISLDMKYKIKNRSFYPLQKDFDILTTDNYNESLQNLSYKEERLIFQDILKNNVEISNLDLGVGISQTLPILTATSRYQNTMIAIEQPELHLHPAVQCEIADEFIRSHKENNNSFIIETHSEHILLRIMKRMRYTAENKEDRDKNLDLTPDDVCLLYVDSHKGKIFIRELKLDKDGTLLSKWPNGFFEESYNEMFS